MNECEIEGPVSLLDEREKQALCGMDEELYEGMLRSAWKMSMDCEQLGIRFFYEKLKQLFPHESKTNTLSANCRLRIKQVHTEKAFFYHDHRNKPTYDFFILLYKKYLFHFSYNNVTDSATKDMIDHINAMKTQYKRESRSAAQIEFFLKNCPQRDTISISYESSITAQEDGRLLHELIGKVRVDYIEKTFVGQRHHYPSLLLFHIQAQILSYLKTIPNLNQ